MRNKMTELTQEQWEQIEEICVEAMMLNSFGDPCVGNFPLSLFDEIPQVKQTKLLNAAREVHSGLSVEQVRILCNATIYRDRQLMFNRLALEADDERENLMKKVSVNGDPEDENSTYVLPESEINETQNLPN